MLVTLTERTLSLDASHATRKGAYVVVAGNAAECFVENAAWRDEDEVFRGSRLVRYEARDSWGSYV